MRRTLVIVALAAVLAAVALSIFFSLSKEGRSDLRAVNGITLGEKGRQLYQQVKNNAHDQQPADAEVALKNEAPPGSPLFQDPEAQAKFLAEGQEAAKEETSGPDEVEDPQTLAEPSQRGCRSGPWVVNHSSRNGARPSMLDAHLTVSHNVAGWADVNAIVAWFNNPRSQASSNYVIDAEGHCAYIVNEAFKAWTQGAFNPWGISIEFIHFSPTATAEHWTDAQLAKGALVFADAHKRWGVPIRLVNPSGCDVAVGITDHDRLECGNEHVDVGTKENGLGVHRGTFPMTRFVKLTRYYTWPLCTVRNVKKRLNASPQAPRSPLVIDGNYSPRAERIMRRFQSAHRLPVDGVVRKATGWALQLQGCNASIR